MGVQVLFCLWIVVLSFEKLPLVHVSMIELRVGVRLDFLLLELHRMLIALVCDVVLAEWCLMLWLRLQLVGCGVDKVIFLKGLALRHAVVVLVVWLSVYLLHVAVGLE